MKMRPITAHAIVTACVCLLPLSLAAADLETLFLATDVADDGTLELVWQGSEVRPIPGPPMGDCFDYVIPCPQETDKKKTVITENAESDWTIHTKPSDALEAKLNRPDNASGTVIWIEGPARGKLKSTAFDAREKDWSLAISDSTSLKIGDDMKQFWSIDLGKAIEKKAQVVPIVRPGRKGCWVIVDCKSEDKDIR